MKTKIKRFKKLAFLWLALLPFTLTSSVTTEAATKLMYPLKLISKLECRFEKFSELDDNCKQDLPILKTKDYEKYAKENDGYNDYTRIYTVLWGASYKYWWDAGNGGHIGVDIATAEGTPVYAIYDGVVINAKNMISRWNNVSVEHTINGKTIVSNYSHLSKIDVEKGDKVNAGDKLWEVGNTGNSFGNHLHFQVDLKSKFHPYYYDYGECPYSYSQISEKWVCYDVLAKHTLDPLLFLETQWAVLNDIQIQSTKVDTSKPNKSAPSNDEDEVELDAAFDESIFDRTVYTGYSTSDIKIVQKIFKELWEYNWEISWDYTDVLESIISYQLKKKVIASKEDVGTGYFGPKTRAQVKSDYMAYLKSDEPLSDRVDVVVSRFEKAKKIDKTGLLSREEIDKKESDEFLKSYKVDFTFDEIGSGIDVDGTKLIKVNITDKKGRPFKGTMPTTITFDYDEAFIKVFPSKLYYFTDGKRDIKVTWVKAGDSSVSIKIGNTVIKKYDFKILGSQTRIIPSTVKVDVGTKSIIGEKKTGSIKFRDDKGKELVWIRFGWKYKLSGGDDIVFCVKKWSIKDIKRVYTKQCSDDKFEKSVEVTYADTVGGILVFDYKVSSNSAKVVLSGASTGRTLWSKSITTTAPKDITTKYGYYQEVMDMIRKWIVTGINKWYFLQDRELTEAEAIAWIENALQLMKNTTKDIEDLKLINDRLAKIEKEEVSSFTAITRWGFLEKAYSYLIFEEAPYISIEYKDLDKNQNKKVNAIFDKNTTWKDQFGNKSYRPEKKLTRGEGAYFLSTLFEKVEEALVTVK